MLYISPFFWDALSAVGTIAASAIALWLGLKSSKKTVHSALVWDGTTRDIPKICLSNPGPRTVIVREIEIFYKGVPAIHYDLINEFRLMDSSVLVPGGTKMLTINSHMEFSLANIESKRVNRKHTLKIIITDIEGSKYRSRQKLSDDDIYALLAGQSILSEK